MFLCPNTMVAATNRVKSKLVANYVRRIDYVIKFEIDTFTKIIFGSISFIISILFKFLIVKT